MLASVVFVPSAPLLVPALAGPRAVDTEEVRAATLAAGRDLAADASTWIAIGATDSGIDQVGSAGTFLPFGVDVPVFLDGSDGDGRPDEQSPLRPGLPLSFLIAGWLRAESGAAAVRPVPVSSTATATECAQLGTQLAARVDGHREPVGILVVGDGATSLSARAPGGGMRESGARLQQVIDAAIGSADVAALAGLDPDECATEGVSGRAAWQVVSALCADRPMRPELRYARAPFGVGYVVAVWTPR
ncbi:hypothetical protein GTV32_05675 [Gordonia sp. SID5947]|uniref:hypothetical protein n=1 Tax=Gordonia sp. SID5947 TaxID=2690315 RepID=UPI001371AFBB|nr:hypothetical protein [Gordonia sp. SID5947]